MVYTTLLWLHIAAGSVTLLAALGAMITKMANFKHTLHVLSGRTFFYGMIGVFLTAVLMTFIRPNLFLFLIAIFSFYFAYMGKRTAQNRDGTPSIADRGAVFVMLTAGIIMVSWGGYLISAGNGNGITLAIFGILGVVFPITQIRRFKDGGIKGKERIASHLGNMMGATIAAITAFLVTNIQTDPVWIAWIAPTVIITPLIFWMMKRTYNPKRKTLKQ